MAKGRFLGFIGKVGALAGNIIPGAGVAGKMAENASKLMKDKSAQAELKKSRDKQIEKETKIAGAYLSGGSPFLAQLGDWFGNAWEFTKKNWYIVLPAALALLWVLFFKKKGNTRRRSRPTARRSSPVRRKRSAQPKGSAWARKMLLARRRKARSRKK